MPDRHAIYLLEAYATSDGRDRISPDQLRAALDGRPGLEIIGLVTVPIDEAVLCLVAAASPRAEADLRALAARYGPGARMLRVSWSPLPTAAET